MSESALNPKRRGLGRGLDALFETSVPANEEGRTGAGRGDHTDVNHMQDVSSAPKMLNISELFPGVQQPRTDFDEEALEELAASLKQYGVLQPLLVRPKSNGEGYEILAGERRWRAAQKAQLHEVPVFIRAFDDSEALQIGLVENLQREDLNPVEEALGYHKLADSFGKSQKEIAALVGKSRSQVTNMMRLMSLPQSVQDMLSEGALSIGHARVLIGQKNAEALAKEIVKKGLSVRASEALVNALKTADNASVRHQVIRRKDSDTLAMERELSEHLGLQTKIDMRGNPPKGTLKISVKSLEQLNFIVETLKGD